MIRPRGICPECHAERRVKADGTMGAHGRLSPSGHTIQRTCPGVDQPPMPADASPQGSAN